MRSFLGLLGAGVLVVIPVAATVWVISICYRFISGISSPIYGAIGWHFPGLEFLTTIVILLGIGFMAKNVFGQRIISGFESFVLALPLVSLVYGAVKQAMESLQSMRGPRNFKRVVYLKYPDTNGLLIGFVTGQCYDPGLQKEFTLVFCPSRQTPFRGASWRWGRRILSRAALLRNRL